MWRRSIDGFRHPSIYLFGAKKRVCGPAHCHSGWSLSSAAPTRRRGVGREPSALGSDYFTFADKLEATLRGIGRRQVREAEEQAAIGSTPCSSIPDGTTACSTRRTRARPTPGRTRTKSRVETTNSRRALARLRAAKPCLYAGVCIGLRCR